MRPSCVENESKKREQSERHLKLIIDQLVGRGTSPSRNENRIDVEHERKRMKFRHRKMFNLSDRLCVCDVVAVVLCVFLFSPIGGVESAENS